MPTSTFKSTRDLLLALRANYAFARPTFQCPTLTRFTWAPARFTPELAQGDAGRNPVRHARRHHRAADRAVAERDHAGRGGGQRWRRGGHQGGGLRRRHRRVGPDLLIALNV